MVHAYSVYAALYLCAMQYFRIAHLDLQLATLAQELDKASKTESHAAEPTQQGLEIGEEKARRHDYSETVTEVI